MQVSHAVGLGSPLPLLDLGRVLEEPAETGERHFRLLVRRPTRFTHHDMIGLSRSDRQADIHTLRIPSSPFS